MRLPLAIGTLAALAVSTSALAQEMTCTDYNALDEGARVAAVTQMMEGATDTQTSASGTSGDQQTTEARREPESVAVQIAEICADDPNKTVMEASREAATNRETN